MHAVPRLTKFFTQLISETSGLSLEDTLLLAEQSPQLEADGELAQPIRGFHALLEQFRLNAVPIEKLLDHPVSHALGAIFLAFPIPFRDEHIHLTGSLDADFVFSRLQPLLEGPQRDLYASKIAAVYGADTLPIRDARDVDRLIRLGEGDRFDRYLKILYLPKLILTSREAHRDAAYHMASRLYRTANVGSLRLKFTVFRETTDPTEQIPGIAELTPEDVIMGLYEGFRYACPRRGASGARRELREVGDLLRHALLGDREIVLRQPRNDVPLRVGDHHVEVVQPHLERLDVGLLRVCGNGPEEEEN